MTTVGGLLVAIPAVFAHNWILRAVRGIETVEAFASEIINHFDRQIVVGAFSSTTRLSAPAGQPEENRWLCAKSGTVKPWPT